MVRTCQNRARAVAVLVCGPGGYTRCMPTQAVAFLATSEPERALRFYRDVIGLHLIEEAPFAIVFDAFGTTLRVQIVESVVHAPYTSFGLQVDDIVGEVRALAAKGISGVRYPQLPQDELGI